MKQGWIQVDNQGTQEPLAPKTMADMVYMDATQSKTVKDALTEGFVAVFAHTISTVNGKRVHNFAGPSGFTGVGRALITQDVRVGDLFTVNGVARNGYQGGNSLFTLPKGYWETFVVDGTSVNFKSGGAEKNYHVMAVPYVTALPTVAQENTFCFITSQPLPEKIYFQSAQPTGNQGEIWVESSTGKTLSVNMSKRDTLMVYPVRAFIKGASAWTALDMYVYQGGQWKGMYVYLYNRGVEHVGVTNYIAGTIAKYATYFDSGAFEANGGNTKGCVWNSFNFGPFKKLYARISTDVNPPTLYCGSAFLKLVANQNEKLYTLDISGVTGSEQLMIYLWIAHTAYSFRVHEVFLE